MEFKEVTVETPDVKEQKERTMELIALRHKKEIDIYGKLEEPNYWRTNS